MDQNRWIEFRKSEFPWEREALQWLAAQLPNYDPWRGWALFEFVAEDGGIAEIDALVLTPFSVVLVEVKSHTGRLTGDAGTFAFTNDSGRTRTIDNPRIAADRKAKKLKSLLLRQPSMQRKYSDRDFRIDAVVFLSNPEIDFRLDPAARSHIYLRDSTGAAKKEPGRGIVHALTNYGDLPRSRQPIDRPFVQALSRALEEAGIRHSENRRKVAGFRLDAIMADGPGYQDFHGVRESIAGDERRVRVYLSEIDADRARKETLERAAQREYQTLRGVSHPGILAALHSDRHELGPAILFEYDPEMRRLDHFMREEASRLSIDDRLSIVRSIAEALRYAHDRRIFHRALSPRSILVGRKKGRILVKIFNWQTAARFRDSTTAASLTRTRHMSRLLETDDGAYLAPEAMTSIEDSGESFDVFGLGAIAYLVFSGRPPAESSAALLERLRAEQGLDIGGELEMPLPAMIDAIRTATRNAVMSRMPSVADFLASLDKIEEDLTDPDPPQCVDPTSAKAGDRLAGGFEIKRRLGTGSTAVAFVARRRDDEREFVLKVAGETRYNKTLADEATALARLDGVFGVAHLIEKTTIGDRTVLVLENAGDRTLRTLLREEGRLEAENLERLGEELLSVVDALEGQGVFHRDIKPENIGVATRGKDQRLHLTLFDFSLATASPENLSCGTPPYIDPFLREKRRGRYDLFAERFAAAMTLYEMATGVLPRFGDGKSDPYVLPGVEATLDGDFSDIATKDALIKFFSKAFRRNCVDRFGNAQEMRREWHTVFSTSAGPTKRTERIAEKELHFSACRESKPETALSNLHFSTRALNALRGLSIETVSALIRMLPAQLSSIGAGFGQKTKSEILTAQDVLRGRFPELVAAASSDSKDVDVATMSIDAVLANLLPLDTHAKRDTTRDVRIALFGLDPADPIGEIPSRSEIAKRVSVSETRVSQIVAKTRQAWSVRLDVRSLANDLLAIVEDLAGAASFAEIGRILAERRGSLRIGDDRLRAGVAAVRIAVMAEAEAKTTPRFIEVKLPAPFVVTVPDEDISAAYAMTGYVRALAGRAASLAGTDPLPSPGRVIEDLAAVPVPSGRLPIGPERLVRLAASAAPGVAVSSLREIYPIGFSPLLALRLSRSVIVSGIGANTGASGRITREEIDERMRRRFPECGSLPHRPGLDDLLRDAGTDLEWKDEDAAFRRRPTVILSTTGSSVIERRPTDHESDPDLSDEAADAARIAARLRTARVNGSFICLTVLPAHYERARREIARIYDPLMVDCDREYIRCLRKTAEELSIDWRVVLDADDAAPGTEDYANLRELTRRSMALLENEITAWPGVATRTICLVNLGLLARFDEISFLERLRERTRKKGPGALFGVWALSAAGHQLSGPSIDHKLVPILSSSEYVRIEKSWLENRHGVG